jgi:hypothetical protein
LDFCERFFPHQQVDEKTGLQAAQKDLRAKAREKSARGGVLSEYVVARRSSATQDMSLFHQPARERELSA